MGRLKNVKPRLSVSKPRLSAPPTINRDAVRSASAPWRSLYGLQRWKDLRVFVYRRDKYKCQQTGQLTIGKYPLGNSPVADHIIPAHKFWFDGRQDLFWDPDNIQTVAKSYHDKIKQQLEARWR